MTTHVPAWGSKKAHYAVVGQSPGRTEGLEGRPFVGPAGSLGKQWLRETAHIEEADCYFTNVYEHVLTGGDAPSTTEVKHGIDRVLRELAELPNLKAVILYGSYAARVAFTLKGGITRVHGKTGTLTLPDEREIPCLACLHPSYVLRQASLRKRQQLDNDCRAVVARLPFIDQPLKLPEVRLVQAATGLGLIGLDTETAKQVGKKVDPRRDPLLITGLSDGRVLLGSPTVTPTDEPIVYNVPFDPVVIGVWDAKWHDPKVLAWLLGEEDTSMKGTAIRTLGQPMMEYDPILRERASHKMLSGVGLEDEDVAKFCGYCVQDATAHRDILNILYARADSNTRFCYETVERPMLRLYSRWTMRGVWRLDREAALRKRDAIDRRVRQMRGELLGMIGIESPHAHQKIAQALGLQSTASSFVEKTWPTLSAKQRQVLTLVGELRSIERQISTYIDAWLEWPHDLLSTDWRPTAAWTGRPGSADLNLQNIPGPCQRCLPCQSGRLAECALNLKPLLLPPVGMAMYEADNSQAELVIAAHLSQDPAMLQAFREGIEIEGERYYDIHTWAQHKLNFASRRDAKIRVLATFYGQTEEGVHADVGVQRALRKLFSGYVAWTEKVKGLQRVPGLFGRYLQPPPTPNQGRHEREAINGPSQGGAVDMLKLQTNKLDIELGGGYSSRETRHMIHDSAIVTCPEDEAGEEFENFVKETMEGAVSLSVPIRVEVKRWGAS